MAKHSHPRGSSGRGTMARHGRLAVTSAWGSLGKGLAMSLAVLLVSVLTFGSIVYMNLLGQVETFSIEGQTESNIEAFEGGVNLLLVGSDTREGQGEEFGEGLEEAEGTLNDVNILLHLSADHSHASVVSIPRDTLVDTPGCTNDDGEYVEEQSGVMINSILQDGGMNCIVATVEEMSGLDIQFASMITFRGVIEMSNAVGGVEVCVEQPIEDDFIGLSLDAGMHSLQGEDALKFLRTRHGVGDGSDLARITNQQVFLSALFRTVKSNETLTNPTKLYGIARAATQNVTMSDNMNNIDTLVSLANALAEVPNEALAFVRLPVAPSNWQEGRVEATDDAEVMWQLLREDKPLAGGIKPPAEPDAGADSGADVADEPTTDDDADTTEPDAGSGLDNTSEPDGGGVGPSPTPTFSGQTADEQTCSNTDSLF